VTEASDAPTAATGLADDLVGNATGLADDLVGNAAGGLPETTDPDLPGWHRPAPGPAERRADAALAGAMFGGSLLSTVLYRVAGFYDDPAAGWVSALCLAAATLPLAWRRRHPAAVALVMTAAAITVGELRVPEVLVWNIALFMAIYSVGAWETDRRRAAWVRGVVVFAMMSWLFTGIVRAATDPGDDSELARAGAFSPFVAYMLIQLMTNVLYFAGAWWFGDHSWVSARERARTAWRGRLLVLERLHAEQQAVEVERLRLARELHDSVAHHVSVMGVQATAARTLLDVDPARAAASLEQLEDSARAAVDELGGILGMLRGGAVVAGADRAAGVAGGAAAGAPGGAAGVRIRDDDEAGGPGAGVAALGVEQIADLVEQARAAGMAVELAVVGEPEPVPPMTSLNAYRIVQEALTNVRKHAGSAARTAVRVRYLDGAVEVEVSDDGTGPRRTLGSSAGRALGSSSGGAPGRSSGLGLVGMAERTASCGGTLTAGPRQRGGFLVRARLPLPAEVRR
jgi:signal transduction histidine kinase